MNIFRCSSCLSPCYLFFEAGKVIGEELDEVFNKAMGEDQVGKSVTDLECAFV